MSEKSLLDKFMEWENTDDLARICENRAFDTFEGGYNLAKKELEEKFEFMSASMREADRQNRLSHSEYVVARDKNKSLQQKLDAYIQLAHTKSSELDEAVEVIKIIHHNLPNIEDKSDVDLRWHVEDFMEKIGEKHEQKGGSR